MRRKSWKGIGKQQHTEGMKRIIQKRLKTRRCNNKKKLERLRKELLSICSLYGHRR